MPIVQENVKQEIFQRPINVRRVLSFLQPLFCFLFRIKFETPRVLVFCDKYKKTSEDRGNNKQLIINCYLLSIAKMALSKEGKLIFGGF
jgi:hypothetical protein